MDDIRDRLENIITDAKKGLDVLSSIHDSSSKERCNDEDRIQLLNNTIESLNEENISLREKLACSSGQIAELIEVIEQLQSQIISNR